MGGDRLGDCDCDWYCDWVAVVNCGNERDRDGDSTATRGSARNRDSNRDRDDTANREPRNDAPLTDTTFRDGAVENGTLYYYRISAVDNAGNEGNPSDEIAVTVFPSPPDRP